MGGAQNNCGIIIPLVNGLQRSFNSCFTIPNIFRTSAGWGVSAVCRSISLSGVYPRWWENPPWQQGHLQPRWSGALQNMVMTSTSLKILCIYSKQLRILLFFFYNISANVETTPWAVKIAPPLRCPLFPQWHRHKWQLFPSPLQCLKANVTGQWI